MPLGRIGRALRMAQNVRGLFRFGTRAGISRASLLELHVVCRTGRPFNHLRVPG